MKLGLIISAVIVAVVAAAAFFLTRGVADLPTPATKAANLEKVTLPSALPAIWTPGRAIGEGDAAAESGESADEAYRRMLATFADNAAALSKPNPPPPLVDQVVAGLIDGLKRENVSDGFLDGQVPLYPSDRPEFGAALEVIPRLVMERAKQAYERGDKPYALRSVLGLWVLGQRLFEHNVRFYNRWQGLGMMKSAGTQLYEWKDELPGAGEGPSAEEKLVAWGGYITAVESKWGEKVAIVRSVHPPIGDLVNLARRDKDATFRVEATLMLGVVKYNPGHRGNKRAIQSAIDDLKADPEPLVARAAKVADAMTVEEVHKLR